MANKKRRPSAKLETDDGKREIMAATLNNIAQLAGVDIGSVSRTLRNHPRAMSLRPETRERIFEAARKLGYRRNELAATIRTGMTRTVAVIGSFKHLDSLDSYSIVISGILKEASRLNYGVKIYSDENLDACFDEILSHKIRHVICMSVDEKSREAAAAQCRTHELRLVYVYERGHGEFPTVSSADREGVRDAVEELARLGHRRIALACGPHHYSYVRERHEGYLDGLKAAGLPPDDKIILCHEGPEEMENAVEKVLSLPKGARPTAFFCIADSLAMRIQRAALRRGLRLPEDVSVIGVGNSHLVKFAVSPISSIAQPFSRMGEVAFDLLTGETCDFAPKDGTCRLPTSLVTRESVAANNQGRTKK